MQRISDFGVALTWLRLLCTLLVGPGLEVGAPLHTMLGAGLVLATATASGAD